MTHLAVFEGYSPDVIPETSGKHYIDKAKGDALDELIDGQPISAVMSAFVIELEKINPNFKCLVMLPDASMTALSPLAAPSLPHIYVTALVELPIHSSSGSCGAAAHTRKPVVIENIFQHPNWRSFTHLAKKSGIGSCWSYPIISNNILLATLSVSQDIGLIPSEEETALLVYAAGVIALLLTRARQIKQTAKSLSLFEQEVKEKQDLLSDATSLLHKAINQRNEVRQQLIDMENMATLGTMMSSLTHEINTPVGVAITASSFLKAAQEKSRVLLEAGQLKRSQLVGFYEDCKEASEIIERNLLRSTQVIKTFKQLAVDQHSLDLRAFNFCDYFNEVLLSLKPKLKRTSHMFCLDADPELVVSTHAGAISQILINLIENAIKHAFTDDQKGQMLINAGTRLSSVNKKKELFILFSDNGDGMDAETCRNIYKPFFSLAKNTGGSGLGMHICYNLAVNVLQGSIECESELGRGTRYSITIPIDH